MCAVYLLPDALAEILPTVMESAVGCAPVLEMVAANFLTRLTWVQAGVAMASLFDMGVESSPTRNTRGMRRAMNGTRLAGRHAHLLNVARIGSGKDPCLLARR